LEGRYRASKRGMTDEEIMEQARRNGFGGANSSRRKHAARPSTPEATDNDVPEIKPYSQEEQEAFSRMLLESQSESLEETHRKLIAAGRKPDFNRYAR